jgi:hypothetical protein
MVLDTGAPGPVEVKAAPISASAADTESTQEPETASSLGPRLKPTQKRAASVDVVDLTQENDNEEDDDLQITSIKLAPRKRLRIEMPRLSIGEGLRGTGYDWTSLLAQFSEISLADPWRAVIDAIRASEGGVKFERRIPQLSATPGADAVSILRASTKTIYRTFTEYELAGILGGVECFSEMRRLIEQKHGRWFREARKLFEKDLWKFHSADLIMRHGLLAVQSMRHLLAEPQLKRQGIDLRHRDASGTLTPTAVVPRKPPPGLFGFANTRSLHGASPRKPIKQPFQPFYKFMDLPSGSGSVEEIPFGFTPEGYLVAFVAYAADDYSFRTNLLLLPLSPLDSFRPVEELKEGHDGELADAGFMARWLPQHCKPSRNGTKLSVTVADAKVMRGRCKSGLGTQDYFITAGHDGALRVFTPSGLVVQSFAAPRMAGFDPEKPPQASRIAIRPDPSGTDWDTPACGYSSGFVDFGSVCSKRVWSNVDLSQCCNCARPREQSGCELPTAAGIPCFLAFTG